MHLLPLLENQIKQWVELGLEDTCVKRGAFERWTVRINLKTSRVTMTIRHAGRIVHEMSCLYKDGKSTDFTYMAKPIQTDHINLAIQVLEATLDYY